MTSQCHLAIGAALTALYYPVVHAKVLIQLGHEPLPPQLSTTLFGNHAYMYPNVLKYMGHIYRTDGFFGLYRGLGCRMISSFVSSVVANSVQDELYGRPIYPKESDEIDGDESDSISNLFQATTYETISRCAGIVCSQPFYVISIRAVAQFVGRETRFSSLFTAIPDIWNNEGILGFFSGLAPRLLAEALTVWIANLLSYGLNYMLFNISRQPSFKMQTDTVSQLIASQITYPFTLVSVVMAVNGSGLSTESSLLMPEYKSWIACWRHLTEKGQMKRGSSLFWRRYHGSKISDVVRPPVEYNRF